MSFNTIGQCANDPAFILRITSCIAQEQRAAGDPASPGPLQEEMRWSVAAAADVEAAYASAVAAGNPNPGGDDAVITDGMILANVQAAWPDAAP